jgi:mannose-6-phosphate isomerase-like protein (cupin superfamily)
MSGDNGGTPMLTRELSRPVVIRATELQPHSKSPHSSEGPYMRRLISWVGGDPEAGLINDNPESGLVSDRTVTGVLWLNQGHRQFGVHNHTVAEIFVVLQGTVESLEPGGRRHVAGPLDCLYMQPGVPHAVRAIGEEDVIFLWIHDALEPAEGYSDYWISEDEATDQGDARIVLVRWDDLEPCWDLPLASQGGHQRWSVSWIGGPDGYLHHNRVAGVTSDRIGLGATVLEPGNREPAHTHDVPEHMIIVRGRASAPDGSAPLGPLDFVLIPPGVEHGLRSLGPDPLYVVWVREDVERVA